MPIVPKNSVEKIEFYENHNTPWAANATAIGTSTTTVSALNTLTVAARTAYNAQQAAQTTAKAATLTLQNAVDAMQVAGANIIQQIKTKAATTGDSVYSLAQIPAPATPGPVGPPGTPTGFKVKLNQDGSVELTWKCPNPACAVGTVYQVFRRAAADGDFTYIGGSGEKRYLDTTLPTGSSQVTYQIQGVRSTSAGPWAQFNVNFGTSSSGGTTVESVEETAPTKKAA